MLKKKSNSPPYSPPLWIAVPSEYLRVLELELDFLRMQIESAKKLLSEYGGIFDENHR